MSKPVNSIALICHPAKPAMPKLVKEITTWAQNNNIRLFLTSDIAQKVDRNDLKTEIKEISKLAKIIVVLGGDGSILQCARTFAADNIPIAGINLGHLGFLTLDERYNAIQTLNKLKDGNYIVEERMMLKASVYRNNQEVFSGVALNDVVIQKEPIMRVIKVKVSICKNLVNSYLGDGLIISGPTGSTAYSLSAGGPIVPPWVNVMLICPLNSHTLSARPVITSDKEVIEAQLSCTHSQVDLVLDGQESFRLQDADEIKVIRSEHVAQIAVLQSRNFFEILRKKMKWG